MGEVQILVLEEWDLVLDTMGREGAHFSFQRGNQLLDQSLLLVEGVVVSAVVLKESLDSDGCLRW